MIDYLLRGTTAWRGKGRGALRNSRAAGAMRVLVYCASVSLLFTAISIHRVYGGARESAMAIGRDLLKMKDVLGPPQPVVINGATMFVGGRHVDLSVAEVLDRFEEHCQERSGDLAADFGKLDEKTRRALPEFLANPKRFSIMRREVEDEGMIACIAAPEGSRGFAGLIDRVAVFLSTGDLAAVGKLRYVLARANAKAGGSNIVTIWQEGSLNVFKMLLSEGDVPGHDVERLPRPPGSVRVLSAEVAGTGYGIVAYEAAAPAAETLTSYEKTLTALGWTRSEFGPATETTLGDLDSRVYTCDGAVAFVTAEPEGERTVLELVHMPTRGAVSIGAAEPLGKDTSQP